MPVTLFTFDREALPAAANPDRATRGVAHWLEQSIEDETLHAYAKAAAGDPAGRRLLDAVFGNSPFLGRCMQREWAFACDLLRDGPDTAFDALLGDADRELGREIRADRMMSGLRHAKRRAALLIGIADITEAWPLEKVMAALSDFADRALALATRHMIRDLAARGVFELRNSDDPERDSGYVVLALGKLGARELNYSSDVDLIVLFDPEKIETDSPEKIQAELVRSTRGLMRLMDERTADGYVFRTDLRLRPDPGTTPLAISIPAAEAYYESVGQNWERMAMIRARPVAGDLKAGEAFLQRLRPFIWRKNLDFAAIQDIHSIKRQITAHRGGGAIAVNGHNIKLGRGGIREIEFFAQTQQLIWGGRNPALRGRHLAEVLEALVAEGQIEHAVSDELNGAYRFLRRLEHRLQMIEDEQTHELPKTDEQVAHIAIFMGFDDAAAFRAALVEHLGRVEKHYARLFEEAPDLGGEGALVFTGNEPHPDTLATLGNMGFRDAASVAGVVRTWHSGRYRATRSERARQLLTELAPRLLAALSNTANPDAAFAKFDEFLGRLPAGVQLLSLFYSNPALLDLVADVMGDAPRLADWLARNPSLLDYVLTDDFHQPIGDFADLAADLEARLGYAEHFEAVLDVTRRWTNDQKFRVGVQILHGVTDGQAAGPALSAIAETVIRALWPFVEREFSIRHGTVPGGAMAAIAYGKLGGREMMPDSDLDLVFVYDHAADAEVSDGAKPLPAGVYYMRLAQRIVSAITSLTSEGKIYEVDLRLRPSGKKGPVATRLDGFATYQADAAWTWEHMALTRARVIAGPENMAQAIAAEIRSTLTDTRDPDRLVVDVADMRRRMAREYPGRSPWDIKHRPGGLFDVEFLTQYLQLKHAAERPEVLAMATAEALANLRSADVLAAGVEGELQAALLLWHRVQGAIRLTAEEGFEDHDLPEGQRNALVRAGGVEDFAALKAAMDQASATVHRHFEAIIMAPAEAARDRLPAQE